MFVLPCRHHPNMRAPPTSYFVGVKAASRALVLIHSPVSHLPVIAFTPPSGSSWSLPPGTY